MTVYKHIITKLYREKRLYVNTSKDYPLNKAWTSALDYSSQLAQQQYVTPRCIFT